MTTAANNNTRLFNLLIVSVLVFLNVATFAQSNPTASAQGFGIFLKNGATLQSSQLQGALALGGDLTLNGNYTVAANSAGTYKVGGLAIGLLVGGKVNYSSGNSFYVNSNAYAIVGNSTGSVAWYKDNNGASSNIRVTKNGYGDQPYIQLQTNASNLGVSATTNPVFQSNPIDFNAAFTTFQASATCMSSYTGNVTLTNPNGNILSSIINSVLTNGQIKINLASGVNVLNVSGTDLNNVSNITFNSSPDASHVLVINVNAGATYNWNVWNQSGIGQSNCPYIIYNFYNTTSLTVSGNNTIEGTLFAPSADINKTSSANIEGQIIANSLIQAGGSINAANFNYNLPACACATPVVPAITGTTSVCVAATTTLADATASGVWTSSNASVATVSGGVVTGVSAGTATIKYAVTNSCGTTAVTAAVTVNANPTVAALTGNANVCIGKTSQLADATASGVWSSSNTSVATVSSGLVTSVAAGTSTISYTVTNASGCSAASTTTFTVNALPVMGAINGNTSVCVSSTVQLTDSTVGGTWSSFNNYVGTINASTGLFTGGAYGTSSVTYSVTNANGCTNSISVTMSVNNNPYVGTIVGSSTVCTNNVDTLKPGASGGVWSASNSTYATINSNGYVTGVTAGKDTIYYTLTNAYGCTSVASTIITVSTNPLVADSIIGTGTVCVGTTSKLSNGNAGGVWSSFNNYVGSINATTGVFTGNASGTTNVTYFVTASPSGCTASTTRTISVVNNPYIGTLTGANSVCVGNAITLSPSVNGGIWTSSNSSIATVSSKGLVTGVAGGNDTISYSLSNANGCSSTLTQSVSVAKPTTSTTTAMICAGSALLFNGTSYNSTGSYTVHLTNAAGCDSAATLSLFVIPMANPSLNITSTATSICAGVSVTFTANVLNAGEKVTYQWNKNGVAIVGANASTYTTSTSANGDKITCTIIVGATCIVNNTLTSNTITITLLDPGTWVGGVDGVWSNPTNWCGAIIPQVNTDVTIPTGATNYPTITGVYPVKSLTIQKGTTLTITGTLQVAGAITNNGVLDATAGTVEFNGTTAQTIPVGALKNNSVKNITINNAAGVTLADSLKVTGTITPTTGTLNTGGKLVLKSSATGTARIAAGTGNYITGVVTVERYINQKTARRFNFVGSTTSQTIRDSWQQQIYVTGAGTGGQPCGAGTGNGGATDKYNSNGFDRTNLNAPSIYTYNATPVNGSRWVSVASTSENLVPGKGYKVNIRGNRNSATVSCADQLGSNTPTAPENVTLSSTGTITTGDVTVTLNDPASNKYSLLGNPYPSQISFTAFQASNSTKIGTKMWSFSPYGNGNYTTYSAGIIANGATSYDNTNGDYIASGQAFFVEALTTGSVTFSESHKTNGTIPNSQYFGVSNNKLIRIALMADTSNTRLDESVIRYNAFGSDNYIPDWDAASLGGGSQTVAIIKGGNRLSIATHSDSKSADTTQVGVRSSAIGEFKLSFSNFEGIDSNKTITLRDKYLGVVVNVRQNSVYRFKITADTGSKGDNRFELFVNEKSNTLPVNFTSIKAAKTEKGASVTWTVANEVNVASYEVERSTDGTDFTTIASAKATGEKVYSVNDNNLPTSNAVYYRVKSVEPSGEAKYSAIAKLNNTGIAQSAISIYPNPVKEQLNITISSANNGSYAVKISTITGKQVLNKTSVSTSSNKISIDANTFSAGVYLVELTNANGVKLTEKFIKE